MASNNFVDVDGADNDDDGNGDDGRGDRLMVAVDKKMEPKTRYEPALHHSSIYHALLLLTHRRRRLVHSVGRRGLARPRRMDRRYAPAAVD